MFDHSRLTQNLDARHVDRVMQALETLRIAHEEGSIRKTDYSSTKSVLNYALEKAWDRVKWDRVKERPDGFGTPEERRAWYDGLTRIEQDAYYWLPYMHLVPGQVKKLTRVADKPYARGLLDFLLTIEPIAKVLIDLKTKVVKGRKPSENPKVDLTNTGTCAICGRRHKLSDAKTMVLHGYERPGHGYLLGRCFGYTYPPYELSCAANKAFVPVLQGYLNNSENTLKRLEQGEVESLLYEEYAHVKGVYVTKYAKKGDEKYPHLLKMAISETQSEIRMIKMNITENDGKITNWKEQPLP